MGERCAMQDTPVLFKLSLSDEKVRCQCGGTRSGWLGNQRAHAASRGQATRPSRRARTETLRLIAIVSNQSSLPPRHPIVSEKGDCKTRMSRRHHTASR